MFGFRFSDGFGDELGLMSSYKQFGLVPTDRWSW